MITERKPNTHDHFCDVEIGESFEYTDALFEDIGYFSYDGEDLYMRIEQIKDKKRCPIENRKADAFQ